MKLKAIQLGLAIAVAFFFSACAGDVNGVPEPRPYPESSVAAGRALIASYGCGSCHSIPGVPGADSRTGPPLDRFYERSYIAGRLPNTEENLVKWIQNPQQIKPGNAMPNMGVAQDQAHDIVAYLYHQPTIGDFFNR